MNVGIDARKYFDFGIGTYIRNLSSFFDRQNEDRFTYFASPDNAGLISRTHTGKTIVNRSGKYSLGELISLSFQANRAGISLFHAPHYTLPFGLSMRRVVTIHDVIHLRFPAYFSPVQRAYARVMIGHACTAADAVIVDSDFAGKELLRCMPCPPEKIHVIPLGVSEDFAPAQDDASADEFRRKHNTGKRFLPLSGTGRTSGSCAWVRDSRRIVHCTPCARARGSATGCKASGGSPSRISSRRTAQPQRW